MTAHRSDLVGVKAAEIVARLPFQRDADRVCRLGGRVFAEILAEVMASGDVNRIPQILRRYAGLDPAAFRAAGGDRFAPVPLRAVADTGALPREVDRSADQLAGWADWLATLVSGAGEDGSVDACLIEAEILPALVDIVRRLRSLRRG